MSTRKDLIVQALTEPDTLEGLPATVWDLLVRQGRSTNLLARLAHLLTVCDRMKDVPREPRHHLLSALQLADRQDSALRWEVECIRKALLDTQADVILLKGAAYVMAGRAVASGRTFSDVDILVSKNKIHQAESELRVHGWQSSVQNEYDQRYYREWMHELPPMRHIRRGTTIDVHHTILPETAKIKVNTTALLKGAVPLDGHPSLFVLKPTDMFLHSATHLFHEGEFEKALRDLFDLDGLLREFGTADGFWQDLVPRAMELGLSRPLYYALRFTHQILGTQIPDHVLRDAEIGKPAAAIAGIMDACFLRALRPVHSSTKTCGNSLARFALYLRSHWVRMPFHLLAYHLGRKAFVKPPKPDQGAILAAIPASERDVA